MQTPRARPTPAVFLACFLVFAGCGQNLTATEHVARAKDYLDKGELRSASIELSSAVQKEPNSVEGRWLLAKVAADMGEGARAEKEIQRAMELGLNRASGQLTLVESVLLQGDLDRVLQESGALPPGISQADQAAIFGLRGQAYVAKGQFELAQETLERALRLKPDSLPALIGMTALHGYQRQYDDARQWVDKAIKSSPTSPEAWSALGDLEMAEGRLAEAEKAFGQAIKHRSTPYLEQIKRAQVRIRLEKYQEAAADIKALRNAGLKDHPYVNYVAGLNEFAQKRYQEALPAFQASYTANPDFLPNRIYLATTQLELGNTEQALSHAQQIASIAPRSITAQGLLGSVMISRVEYGQAKDVLQKILVRVPNEPQALAMLSTVYLREGDTAKGLELAQKLAALEPDSKAAQDMLMIAKLMAGEALDSSIQKAGAHAAARGDTYTGEFVGTLAAFRDGKLKQALDSAQAMQTRYPDKVDPPKLAAAVYLATAQWDLAKAELEKVLRIQPSEPSATRNLAKVESIKGNHRRAREWVAPLVKQQPGDVEAARILATAESRLGNPAGALEALEQASKARPDDLQLLAELSQTQLKMGRPGKVLEATQRLTDAQFSQEPSLLELRGKAQLLVGDITRASSTFEKWTRLSPKSAPAHFNYANALAGRGDAARARKELEQAIRLDPRYLPARVGEIKMHVQANRLDQARKALTRLRQDFGDRAEVLGIEGWFALGTRDFATAEQKLAAAFKKAPDAELLILTTRAQWAQKKHDPALKAMHDWLKNHPRDLPVRMQLAAAYLSLDKEADAAAAYEQALKLAPDHVTALNNLAWLNRDKAPMKAIDLAQQAYRLAPKDPLVLDTLGMLTLKNGDANSAVSLLRNAIARAPDDAQIRLHLAAALIRQGKTGEAQKLLQKVITETPGTRVAAEAQTLLNTVGRR